MPFDQTALFEAIGQTMFSFWQIQKTQEEMYLAQLAEKDKEIEALKLKLPDNPTE
jgi:hypothetical protein